MYKYIINQEGLPGDEIVIIYNSIGRLLKIDATNAPGVSVRQIDYLKYHIPAELTDPKAQLSQLVDACKGKISITQSSFDVDFTTFWEAYNYKRHKEPAQKLYEKLSYADKHKCIASIPAYDKYRARKGWLEKMLPDTWIRKREFDTEWHRIS